MVEFDTDGDGDGDGGVSFPVVFHDGEQDSNIGHIVVSASTDFKNFQSILSRKIGISSHQFTVYLADFKVFPEVSPKIRRRIPITGKVNFAAIAGEKNSFFLVVLKRSRRERRRKSSDYGIDDAFYFPKTKIKTENPKKKGPPGNVMILRRNIGNDSEPPGNMMILRGNDVNYNEPQTGFFSSIVNRFDYEERMQKLRFEKEKYLKNMGFRGFSVAGDFGRKEMICRDCMNAEADGVAAGFHCCANDDVTMDFRSHAGPISRPVK